MRTMVLVAAILTGCALHAHVDSPAVNGANAGADCAQAPEVPRGHFRHLSSRLAARAGSSRHRGVDLIASETDGFQTLGGKFAYTAFDKDLEDEDVAVFACIDAGWRPLGTVRTDEDGRFALTLTGARRLPVGMHDLYATAIGDGTGVRYLAYVAPAGTRVMVTDVDGTLTRSEHAMFATILLGDDIEPQPGAAEALAASGYPIVYVTGRGDQYTEVTRQWLQQHGFPRGPLRLAPSSVMLPGARTAAFKAETLKSLHLPIAAAVGNRASDIAAYAGVGLSPARIFIHLPEFTDEVGGPIAAHLATGFSEYPKLGVLLQ